MLARVRADRHTEKGRREWENDAPRLILASIAISGASRRRSRWGSCNARSAFYRTPASRRSRAWQDETRVALRKIAPTAERGTFAKDAERYLRAVASMPTFKEREKHIALWSAEFGPRAATLDHDGRRGRGAVPMAEYEAVAVDGAEPSHGTAARVEPSGRPRGSQSGEAGTEARPAGSGGSGAVLRQDRRHPGRDAGRGAGTAPGRPETTPARRRHGWPSSPTPACRTA